MKAAPLLYDPDCGFCRVCVALVLRWDRGARLRPVALRSTEAEELLEGMPEDRRMASWHLVERGWQQNVAENATNRCHLAGPARPVWSGGAAFSPLFRRLPGGAPLARLTDRFPRASDRAYRWVADHRSAFGRPVPPTVRRWADRVISESRAGDR
jgi:predicted DCC family thiol-disulfide oxidoreductase YuxK